MSKGPATRSAIIDAALSRARRTGLAGITLGVLASDLGLSKSGLFAHFKSKEALQLAVLEEAGARFAAGVVTPAMAEPRGREQLSTLFARYLDWMGEGCVYSTIAQELAVLPAPVASAFRDGLQRWQRTIAAVSNDSVGAERAAEVALQFVGLALAYQQAVKVFGDTRSRRQVQRTFDHSIATKETPA
jgi:AcrR family transcriptional regulator